MVTPYIKNLAEMTLGFISEESLLNPTRICAMNFLNVLIETQKASLLKADMIRPIVSAVFTIMCKSEHPLQTKSNIETMLEDIDADDEDVDDTENLFTNATQVSNPLCIQMYFKIYKDTRNKVMNGTTKMLRI